jgi:O-acetyl-ADP-ribose deacetylase (regulator of RNase III)
MIKIIKGNILYATEDIIAHQCNCQGIMGAGLAKQIRNKYPEVYESYKRYCNNTIDKSTLLGCTQFVNCFNGKCVANLFGQYGYGRDTQYTDYDALEFCLKKVNNKAIQHKQSVALPYGLGCGLAGGDWNIVYRIIEEVFKDYDVTIYKLS